MFSTRAKNRRPAGDILRLPLVEAASRHLDLESEIERREVEGLRYPLPGAFPVSDLCEISLTSPDVSSANWLLGSTGEGRVNSFMRSAGSKATRIDAPFMEEDETPRGQASLRDSIDFLRRGADDPQIARWLRRNRQNPFASEWMPDEIDVWHQAGSSPYSVFDISLIGDRPRWILGFICEYPADPEASTIQVSHQGLRIRQALLEDGLIRSGI